MNKDSNLKRNYSNSKRKDSVSKRKDSILKRKYIMLAGACILVIVALVYYYFFSAMLIKPKTQYLFIDNDDNIDSVDVKLSEMANSYSMTGFRTLTRHSSYAERIIPGRYEIKKDNGAFAIFRKLRSGMQSPVNLTIPSVRTDEKLAEALSDKLMFSKADFLNAITNDSVCAKYGFTKETILCMFIPNTYEVYWNISIDKLLNKMNDESKKFWTFERKNKAKAMELSPNEVITLASIVDEETANDAEKPMIAGMYYNRLKEGMPLQADPTIKFALKQFELKRIYQNMLSVNSPYNTYKNIGLPPGPIRIPTVKGIDAVLNYIHHDYLYMCAKEDFSGTHNFARTYSEHLQNAAKYTKALNERGIN